MYCDVAVIGGGAGGVGAAIEAARHGKHVILFEKEVSLGGLATNGYVPQIAGNVEGICLEFARRMDELGYLKHQDKEDGIARFPNMFDTHHPTSDSLVFIRHIHMDPAADHGSGITIERDEPAQMHPFFEPEGVQVRVNPRDWCDIPYRCLVPRKVDNLLAAGRCSSTEFHANGAIRIIGPAMSTG